MNSSDQLNQVHKKAETQVYLSKNKSYILHSISFRDRLFAAASLFQYAGFSGKFQSILRLSKLW